MKVLHIITGLSQGGAERQLANLLSVLQEETSVFSLKRPGVIARDIRKAGVPIYSAGVQRSFSSHWIPKLRDAVRDFQPDLIMGWMYHGNLAAALTRRLGHQGKIAWNVRHSVHDMRREKVSTRWAIKGGAWFSGTPTCIIYNSLSAAKQHEILGYPISKRVVLPNGFDLERFKPDLELRKTRRAAFGIPTNRFILGVMGRVHPMKNHHGWLKAFEMLVNDGLPVHCVMAGTGVAEPQGAVARAVRQAGLESNVTLLPPTDFPESLYPAFDLLVMPSLWGEGFPNVVGEAMACGVPALVTDVGDAVSVVGDFGFVSECGAPDFLANEVRSALANGREALALLGSAARKRVMRCYELESVSLQYSELFRDLCGE